MKKRSRRAPLTPTVSQEPLGRLLASILAASGRHFGAQSSPGAPPRAPGAPPGGSKKLDARGAQGLPGAPREASGRQFRSNFEPSGRDFRHFFLLRMPPGSSFATILQPLTPPRKRQKRQRDATRDPRNWRSFPRQGRGGVVTLRRRLY